MAIIRPNCYGKYYDCSEAISCVHNSDCEVRTKYLKFTINKKSEQQITLERVDATLDLVQIRLGEVSDRLRGLEETFMDYQKQMRALIGPPERREKWD